MHQKKQRLAASVQTPPALNESPALDSPTSGAVNDKYPFNLVKIASDWKRRDRGVPNWWRNHLQGTLR
jgi:hypothetical protein